MKKVTIQTKEKVEELMDVWTAKYGHPEVDDMVRNSLNGTICHNTSKGLCLLCGNFVYQRAV